MIIGIASDHAGFDLKSYLIENFIGETIKWVNFGTNSKDSCDYPDYVHPLCNALCERKLDFGVVICGSANGVAITANKHSCVRAAICWNQEVAKLARNHNNANVCALPARFLSNIQAREILEVFLNSYFEGGRHLNRVEKIKLNNS